MDLSEKHNEIVNEKAVDLFSEISYNYEGQ